MSGDRLWRAPPGSVRALALLPPDHLADGELVTAFAVNQDAGAFEALVRRHGSMVLGTCHRLLRHHQDAEDAFQATFLVLARKAGTVHPPGAVASWLYGVAVKAALKARAMRERRRRHEVPSAQVPEPPARKPTAPDEELRGVLDAELSALPDRYRTVVVLCDLEGRTRREAARHLDCPEGSVSSRLARARVLLARRLARRGLTAGVSVLGVGAAAAVPTGLVAVTVRAVSGVSTASGVPDRPTVLAEEVLKMMTLSSSRAAALVLLAAAVLGGGAFGVARVPTPPTAGTPGGTAPKNTQTAPGAIEAREPLQLRSEDVSAPVDYRDTMLVMSNEKGVAAVAFTTPIDDKGREGFRYQYRFHPAGGGKETDGEGELYELLGTTGTRDWRTTIQAGPVELVWSKSGAEKGWVYYSPERLRVQIASARTTEFDREGNLKAVELLGRLDLSRFEK